MTTNEKVAEAARRLSLATVQSMGGACVMLQVPSPPVAGDDGEELGLSSPQFQSVALAPVVVKRSAKAVAVRVPAEVLEQAFGVSGAGAVATALASVSTAVLGDEAFVFSGLEAVGVGGTTCLYRLLLQPRATEVV